MTETTKLPRKSSKSVTCGSARSWIAKVLRDVDMNAHQIGDLEIASLTLIELERKCQEQSA